MTKRIVALIIVVIIPIALLGGCKNVSESEKATLQEYYNGIVDNYSEYVSETKFGNSPEAVRKMAETREAALDKFVNMAVPPSYVDRHNALMTTAETEREWDKILLEYADGKIDSDKLSSERSRVYKTGQSEFTTKCYEIITALNHEPGVTPSEYGLKLEKLNEMFS